MRSNDQYILIIVGITCSLIALIWILPMRKKTGNPPKNFTIGDIIRGTPV